MKQTLKVASIATTTSDHRDGLRDLLEDHRRRLSEDLHARVARLRDEGAALPAVKEDEDGQCGDLDVAMMEMITSTLRRVDVAIARVERGEYGFCTRCHGPIEEVRLRAMPFAVCCRECENARERQAAALRGGRSRWREWGPAAEQHEW